MSCSNNAPICSRYVKYVFDIDVEKVRGAARRSRHRRAPFIIRYRAVMLAASFLVNRSMKTSTGLGSIALEDSPVSAQLHEKASRYANIELDLLLYGETGTGKDTLAKHIHELSGRTGSWVGINCAAIPETLAESQLFGVMSGAFTGVTQSRMGYIEAAQMGTLYLDEIDSMPLSLQAKLLRTLESRGIERLGSTTFIPVDFRVIASAQRPLGPLVDQGLFRRDLFFRLNALTIQLPALRTCREQILPMFHYFTSVIAEHFNRAVPALDGHLEGVLLGHAWSGNIRELRSAAHRFVLGFPLLGTVGVGITRSTAGLKTQLRLVENELIKDALKRHQNSIDAVVDELDIPKRTLYSRMKASCA